MNTAANIIYLAGADGYRISTHYGKILYGGRSWKTLTEAENFCKEENIEYEIA